MIQQEGDRFVISCREWAAMHLGRDIKYSYRTKRSAERAVKDVKRNLITKLCDYSQKLFTRVCVLETILLRIKKGTELYEFDDVESAFSDGGVSLGFDTGAAGDDTSSSGAVAGSEGGVGGADAGFGGSDGSDFSDLGSSPRVQRNTPRAPTAT